MEFKKINEQEKKKEPKEISKIMILFFVVTIFIGVLISISTCNNDYDCDACGGKPYNSSSQIEISTTRTCTDGGISTIQCRYCKQTADIELFYGLGHDFKITKNEATCLQGGNVYYACKRSGCSKTKIEWENASPLKHQWIEIYSKQSISHKYADYKCSVCNETKTSKTTIDIGYQIKNTEEKFYYATAAAIKIVKERLKYPSSAKFLPERLMEVHYNGESYLIEGAVSAPNAFNVYTDYYFIVRTKIRIYDSKFTYYDYDCILDN